MKTALMASLFLVSVAACESRPGEETARGVDAADTVITTEQQVDTSIITRDTTVEVDTITREGDRPVGRDTLQGGGATMPTTADTALVDTLRQ